MATAAQDVEKAVNNCLDKLATAGVHTVGAMVILKDESQKAGARGLPGIAQRLWNLADDYEWAENAMQDARFGLNGLISDVHQLTGTDKPAEAADRYTAIHQKAREIEKRLTGVQRMLDSLINQSRAALDGGNPDDVVRATTNAWQAAYDAAAYANWASELAGKEAQRCKAMGTRQ